MAVACELKGADPAAETLHVVSWLLDISGPHRESKLASHGFVVAVPEIYHELGISQRGRESFLVGVFTATCLHDTPAPPHRQGRPLALFSVQGVG